MFFWKKESATWKHFWGMEQQYGLGVFDKELEEAGVPEHKRLALVQTVQMLMIVQTKQVLSEIKEHLEYGRINL